MAKKKRKKSITTMYGEGKSFSYSNPYIGKSNKKAKSIRQRISKASKHVIKGSKNRLTGTSMTGTGGIAGRIEIFTPSKNTESKSKELRDSFRESPVLSNRSNKPTKKKPKKKRPGDTTGFGTRSTYNM